MNCSVSIWPSVRHACSDASAGAGSRPSGQRRVDHGAFGPLAVAYVENRPATVVVVDDAVVEAIKTVALAHELRGDCPALVLGHLPFKQGLAATDGSRRLHEAVEPYHWHVRCDAVIVGGVTLCDGQPLAASLRTAHEIAIFGLLAIEALDEDLRRIVRLLQLRKPEVPDGFVIEGPLDILNCVSGVAAVCGEAPRNIAGRGARQTPDAAGSERTAAPCRSCPRRPDGSNGDSMFPEEPLQNGWAGRCSMYPPAATAPRPGTAPGIFRWRHATGPDPASRRTPARRSWQARWARRWPRSCICLHRHSWRAGFPGLQPAA